MSQEQINRYGRFTEHRVPKVYCSNCWNEYRKKVEVIFLSIVAGGGNTHISTGHLFCPECKINLCMCSGDRYQLYLLQALDPYNKEETFI